MQKKGHSVLVVAGDTYSDKKHYETYYENYDGIQVLRIRLNHENFSENYVNFKNDKVDTIIKEVFNSVQPEVLHCHNMIGLSVAILDIAYYKGIKTILTLHDHWGFCMKNTLLKNGEICSDFYTCSDCLPALLGSGEIYISIKARRDYIRYVLDKVSIFISPSQYLLNKYLEANFPSYKMKVLWNGIDVDYYKNIVKKESTTIRFSYIGYMGAHKGIQLLLDALLQLKDKNVELNLVGDGELLDEYKAFTKRNNLEKNVRFWGKIQNNEINKVYEETDVYVIASIWPENQPVTITEALATGTPVIASNLGGNVELVESEVDGFLFESGNVLSLEEKMLFFINNPQEIEIFGKRGMLKMENNSFSNQVDELLELYDDPSVNLGYFKKSPLVAVTGSKLPYSFDLLKNSKCKLTLLSWLIVENYKNVDICVILRDDLLSEAKIEELVRQSVILIVPEDVLWLKNIVIEKKCGVYYKNNENIVGYLVHILNDKDLMKLLANR